MNFLRKLCAAGGSSVAALALLGGAADARPTMGDRVNYVTRHSHTDGSHPGLAKDGVGVFETDGDYVHDASSDPKPAVAGHGCWHVVSGNPGSQAEVKIKLEAKRSDGNWYVIDIGDEVLPPAPGSTCGSGYRATARHTCDGGLIAKVHYRTVIDANIIDHTDTSEQFVTPVQVLYCRPTNDGGWA